MTLLEIYAQAGRRAGAAINELDLQGWREHASVLRDAELLDKETAAMARAAFADGYTETRRSHR